MEVARAVVVPARDRVDQPRRIVAAHEVGEEEIRADVAHAVVALPRLAPPFVVDDPRHDAGVALVLLDHVDELAVELVLDRDLVERRRGDGALRPGAEPDLGRRERGHVLDEEQA